MNKPNHCCFATTCVQNVRLAPLDISSSKRRAYEEVFIDLTSVRIAVVQLPISAKSNMIGLGSPVIKLWLVGVEPLLECMLTELIFKLAQGRDHVHHTISGFCRER